MLSALALLVVADLGADGLLLEHKDAFRLAFDLTNLTEALDPSEVPIRNGDGIDFEDGLVISDEAHFPATGGRNFERGEQLAQRWNLYANGELYQHFMQLYGVHFTDAVASKLHNFMFIDNVKAGSSSVRTLLRTALNRNLYTTDFANCTKTGKYHRYSTKDFIEQAKLFKFSFVRDPVAKFESGVREAWNSSQFKNMTADEMLDKQIETWEAGNRIWLNEHLQPSSFRLFTFGSGTHPSLIKPDFLAQLESFDSSWLEIVDSLNNINATTRTFLLEHAQEKLNSRPHDAASKLSQAGIKRMCKSALYKFEWACFDYMLPKACQ